MERPSQDYLKSKFLSIFIRDPLVSSSSLKSTGLKGNIDRDGSDGGVIRSVFWKYYFSLLPTPSPFSGTNTSSPTSSSFHQPSTPTTSTTPSHYPSSSSSSPWVISLSQSRKEWTDYRKKFLRAPDGKWVRDGRSAEMEDERGLDNNNGDGEGLATEDDGYIGGGDGWDWWNYQDEGEGEEEGFTTTHGRKGLGDDRWRGENGGMVGDLNRNNPLSLDSGNPWQVWFQDLALRKVIRLDVERTFPDNPYFQQPRIQDLMTDLLFVYAKLNESTTGYRQGMHELLAPILWVVDLDSLPPPTWTPSNNNPPTTTNNNNNNNNNINPSKSKPSSSTTKIKSTPLEDHLIHNVLSRKHVPHDVWILFQCLMKNAREWYETEMTVPVPITPTTTTTSHNNNSGTTTHHHRRPGSSSSSSTIPPSPIIGVPQATGASIVSGTTGGGNHQVETKLVQPVIATCLSVRDELVRKVDGQLWKRLKEVEPQMWGIRWIRLLFGREFPPMLSFLILWDGLFAEDPSLRLVKHVCVAMLERVRDILIPADESTFFMTLLRYPSPSNSPPPSEENPPDHLLPILIQQAIHLRENPSPSGGAFVRAQNLELGISERPKGRSGKDGVRIRRRRSRSSSSIDNGTVEDEEQEREDEEEVDDGVGSGSGGIPPSSSSSVRSARHRTRASISGRIGGGGVGPSASNRQSTANSLSSAGTGSNSSRAGGGGGHGKKPSFASAAAAMMLASNNEAQAGLGLGDLAKGVFDKAEAALGASQYGRAFLGEIRKNVNAYQNPAGFLSQPSSSAISSSSSHRTGGSSSISGAPTPTSTSSATATALLAAERELAVLRANNLMMTAAVALCIEGLEKVHQDKKKKKQGGGGTGGSWEEEETERDDGEPTDDGASPSTSLGKGKTKESTTTTTSSQQQDNIINKGAATTATTTNEEEEVMKVLRHVREVLADGGKGKITKFNEGMMDGLRREMAGAVPTTTTTTTTPGPASIIRSSTPSTSTSQSRRRSSLVTSGRTIRPASIAGLPGVGPSTATPRGSPSPGLSKLPPTPPTSSSTISISKSSSGLLTHPPPPSPSPASPLQTTTAGEAGGEGEGESTGSSNISGISGGGVPLRQTMNSGKIKVRPPLSTMATSAASPSSSLQPSYQTSPSSSSSSPAASAPSPSSPIPTSTSTRRTATATPPALTPPSTNRPQPHLLSSPSPSISPKHISTFTSTTPHPPPIDADPLASLPTKTLSSSSSSSPSYSPHLPSSSTPPLLPKGVGTTSGSFRPNTKGGRPGLGTVGGVGVRGQGYGNGGQQQTTTTAPVNDPLGALK